MGGFRKIKYPVEEKKDGQSGGIETFQNKDSDIFNLGADENESARTSKGGDQGREGKGKTVKKGKGYRKKLKRGLLDQ